MRNELAQVDSLAVGSARVMEATKGNSLASGRREECAPACVRVRVTGEPCNAPGASKSTR